MGFLRCLLREKFPFSFFSLGRSNLQPVSYDFLPHSSSYLPRTWLEYLRGAEREAAVVRSQPQPVALQYSICSRAVQYLPAGPHVLCSSLLAGRPLLQGHLAWTRELRGAAIRSQYYLGVPVSFL